MKLLLPPGEYKGSDSAYCQIILVLVGSFIHKSYQTIYCKVPPQRYSPILAWCHLKRAPFYIFTHTHIVTHAIYFHLLFA